MYEINGLTGRGDLPGIAGSESGPAIVLGGAACVWDDVRAAFRLFVERLSPYSQQMGYAPVKDDPFSVPEGCTIIAVNDIAVYWPQRLDHIVSYHEDFLHVYTLHRGARTGITIKHPITHTQTGHAKRRNPHPPADVKWSFDCVVGGSSTLLACAVALGLGNDRVIVCGAPMDNGPHFFDPEWIALKAFGGSTAEFEWCRARESWFQGRVRSMNGRTRTWLGTPSRRWLNGDL